MSTRVLCGGLPLRQKKLIKLILFPQTENHLNIIVLIQSLSLGGPPNQCPQITFEESHGSFEADDPPFGQNKIELKPNQKVEDFETDKKKMLKSEPSLSIYCESGDGLKPEDPVTGKEETLERMVSIGDSVEADFSFAKHKEEDGGVVKKLGVGEREDEQSFELERPLSPPMHLAAGLGIDKFDLYGSEIKFDFPSFDDDNCGDYYKGMLDEYPLHPLLLRNYANFLEYKGDLSGAEEYYHKCTVVEPSDGVALANYGRLVMKLHQDEAKASSYFERAVQASPADSNVLAAYASFLWDINDEDDDEDDDSFGDRALQGKEDFENKPEAAENRSSKLSETEDGETLCRYAKAFWSINGDHEKALFYFEKAVQASPNDSIILGEYARFLWEIEE